MANPPAPAPPVPEPAAAAAAAARAPLPVPAAVPDVTRSAPATPAPSSTEDDDAAIRRIVAAYGRAIENKDLGLFRAIKPNLSAEEERRLQAGFRAVTSQRVNLSIASIDHRGADATVTVMRQDTIQAGGRQQTLRSQQTLKLSKASAGWAIVDIR
jgi:hypothetical protein